MTDVQNANLRALDEIEDVLVAYAEARLSPSGPVLARMRAHALAQADVLAGQRAIAAAIAATDTQPRRWTFPSLHLPRRAFALGGAALLTLSTGAAVLAAPPGSPLFEARVAVETAFLPAEVGARLTSHEQHLDEWLAAAESAAARGDVAALQVALAAYQAEVDATVAQIGTDAERLAHFDAVLAKHVEKLTALAARLTNETASENAVEHALAASERAAHTIKDKKDHVRGGPSRVPPGQTRAEQGD